MRPLLRITLAPLLLVACSAARSGTDAGTTSATPATPLDAAGTEVGVDCRVDKASGTLLCAGVTFCPTLRVPADVFPDCGFRPRGSTLDLECLCSGMFCPIGVPTTCDEAAKLLSTQNELNVCVQVSEGRCTGGTAGTSTSSPSPQPTGTAKAGCDKNCMQSCGGGADCASLCGC